MRNDTADFMQNLSLNFYLANAVKYIVSAAKCKDNEVADLFTAIWYIERYMEKEEEIRHD